VYSHSFHLCIDAKRIRKIREIISDAEISTENLKVLQILSQFRETAVLLIGTCIFGRFLLFLVHGQVTIIFVVSVCPSVCLFVQTFSQPSLIRFRSN